MDIPQLSAHSIAEEGAGQRCVRCRRLGGYEMLRNANEALRRPLPDGSTFSTVFLGPCSTQAVRPSPAPCVAV